MYRFGYGGHHALPARHPADDLWFAGAARHGRLSTILFISVFAFFAKFWTHGGQTLGMQVWGIRVQNADGSAIDIWQALLRFLIALFSWLPAGLGFWWMLFDKQKRTWSDMYSGSDVVQLPKNIHKK